MRVLGGSQISSSRGNASKPFDFNLGRWPSEAMHGWDKAISTMHKGEVATLICGPQYAFGEKGAPPKIPPNATIETELELVDWLDFEATYNAKPGVRETDSERLARWRQEIADGSSPINTYAGLDKKVQDEVERRSCVQGDGTRDATNRKIYDVNSEEARKILSKQRIQGYTNDFGYIEKSTCFDLYIPVPKGTKPKDVKCEIHPNRMQLSIEGVGVITEGEFEGKLALDGCYWFMTDMSLDPIPINLDDPSNLEDVREGPVQRGETCVQVFLEKMKPYDTLWRNVFIQEGDDRILLGDGREENHGMPVEDDELDNNLNGR